MKKRSILDFFFEIFLLAISAFFYSISFPSFLNDNGMPIFAVFSLIPMFYVIDKTSWKLIPLYGFLFGVGYLAIFNYWLSTFHALAIFIAPTLKGLQLALLFPVLKAGYSFPKKGKVIIQSLVYVGYTYLAQLGFLGYPYGSLYSAFSTWLPLIQIASITGVWGISLLMVVPQCYIASLIEQSNGIPIILSVLRDWKKIIIYISVFVFVLIFGFFSISYWKNKTPDKIIKIATVQHNSDTWQGGYSHYKENFETMRDLTLEAMKGNPDLVMWSETAFVPSVAWHTKYPSSRLTSKLVDDFVSFGSNLKVPLVTGNPEGVIEDSSKPAFDEDGMWNRIDYNSVILFYDGQLQESYRKQHLVPFTEYFPYGDIFPNFYEWLKAHDYHWWLQGKESTVFEYNGVSFSTAICFEDIFGNLSRKFVLGGSNLLLNLSNDSWSKAVSAEMQHLNLGIFRAIENRKSIVRSTNSGMTCYVTSWGQVVNPIEPFTCNYQIYDVPIYDSTKHTIYTKFGDYFGLSSLIISIFIIIFSIPGKINRNRKEKYDLIEQENKVHIEKMHEWISRKVEQ